MNLLLLDDEELALRMLDNAVALALPLANRASFTSGSKAIEYLKETHIDIAFLDINTVGLSGLNVARILKKQYPNVNIIFCTGHKDYALEAHDLFISAYLLKPIRVEQIKDALNNLRYPLEELKRVHFHCFGNFEVFCDGKPITFNFKRTKELLAYLVDRDGVDCTIAEIVSVVFEDKVSRTYLSQLRKDLVDRFTDLEISHILRISRGRMGIYRDAVTCDYFDYLDGKHNRKPEEYMTQYSFGEITMSSILNDLI